MSVSTMSGRSRRGQSRAQAAPGVAGDAVVLLAVERYPKASRTASWSSASSTGSRRLRGWYRLPGPHPEPRRPRVGWLRMPAVTPCSRHTTASLPHSSSSASRGSWWSRRTRWSPTPAVSTARAAQSRPTCWIAVIPW